MYDVDILAIRPRSAWIGVVTKIVRNGDRSAVRQDSAGDDVRA